MFFPANALASTQATKSNTTFIWNTKILQHKTSG